VKLRKQISDGIRSRSTAIRNALTDYNRQAVEVQPPRPVLDIEEVLRFTEIGQFEFLRDSRYEIQQQPWAQPTGRQAMDLWYKVQRAKEECVRIRVEAKRLLTYIIEEENALTECIYRLIDSGNHLLANQLKKRLTLLMSQNSVHIARLTKLSTLVQEDSHPPITPGIRKGNSMSSLNPYETSMANNTTVSTVHDDAIDSDDDGILEDLNTSLDLLVLID